MITRLTVRNYRSLACTDTELCPLTVLVGANGSGKSNLVDVLHFVRDILVRGLDKAISDRNGISEIRRWSVENEDICIQFHFNLPDCSGEYGFSLGITSSGEYRVTWEKYVLISNSTNAANVFEIRNGQWLKYPDRFSSEHRYPAQSGLNLPPLSGNSLVLLNAVAQMEPISGQVTEYLSKMGFYNIYPKNLRPPQKPLNTHPLDEQGVNLASVLRDLKKKTGTEISNLLDAFSAVVPDVNDYTVDMIGGYLVTHIHHTPVNGNMPTFELANESEGTLRILGILTALYQAPQLPLVTIEEPELNIHPGAMGVLRDVLDEVSGRTQVIVTTHSPDLIAELPADVLLIAEKENSITKIGPISEIQRQAVTEKLFWPGELMRIEGLRRETHK